MKIIRDIVLELDYDETAANYTQYASDFAFHCRFIGNFLKRMLKKSKFSPSNYSRIYISACEYSTKPTLIFDGTLKVYIPFSKEYYESLKGNDIIEYFIELYKSGISKASETHSLPTEFLFDQLLNFRLNNYKNQWDFKSKSYKDIGVKVILSCQMTSDKFTLYLMVFYNDKLIFENKVFNTLPDELIYHYRFKDVIIKSGILSITDRFGEISYEVDLSSLFKSNNITVLGN